MSSKNTNNVHHFFLKLTEIVPENKKRDGVFSPSIRKTKIKNEELEKCLTNF